MLHGLPELHRDADRDDGHERTGHRGGEEARREAVENGGDRNCKRGEVRATAWREAARPYLAGPGSSERARLGSRDCAMLGAVQAQRASAEQPDDDQRRREQARRELEPVRQGDEAQRQQDRAEEKETLAQDGRRRVHGRAAPSTLPAASVHATAGSGLPKHAGSASLLRAAHRCSSRTPNSAR